MRLAATETMTIQLKMRKRTTFTTPMGEVKPIRRPLSKARRYILGHF